MLKRKRGQLKIQEMAFILLAVVFLFALVFLFFARFQYAQTTEQARMLREFRSATLLRVIAGLPELQCSLQGSKGISVCIDEGKLLAFQDPILKLNESYAELWRNSNIAKISIEEVYPKGQKYVIYNRKKYKGAGTITTSTYIPLCNEMSGTALCTIAKIKIRTIIPE